MKFLLLSGTADELLPFRGDLIETLLKKGIEVHVALPDLELGSDLEKMLLSKGMQIHHVSVHRVSMNPIADLNTLWQLVVLMRAIRPDIVFTCMIKSVIYGLLAARIVGVPKRYASISGLGYAFTSGGQRGLVRLLAHGLYALSLRGAHKVFFENPDDRKLFLDQGILKPTIPNRLVNGIGVNMEYYARTALPKGPPRFLLVGRLLRDKGVREYAAAAKIIKAKYPEAHFGLVGWIDLNPSAIKQAELDTWIAEGTIDFMGRLDDVRPAIAQCSVFVLPSYREGTPRSVLEAMSMGRGIITTDAPGCRETVVNEDNGLFVPVGSINELAEAMERFFTDPKLAEKMAERSFKIAEDKYDVRKVDQVLISEMGIN
jgi:glycosyltransferase involved in cell wall biosynthesis